MSYDIEHGVDRESETYETRQRRLSFHIRELLGALDMVYGRDGVPKGMSQEFIDSLDRVDKKSLKKDEECSICSTPFLENQYPLVVSLPCNGHHKFDLECISKWLTSTGTCPMCRHDFNAPKKLTLPKDDDEEEFDNMYA